MNNYKILNKLLGTDYWVKAQACIEDDNNYYLCWLYILDVNLETGICTVAYLNLDTPDDWDWVDLVEEDRVDDVFNNTVELYIDDICIDEPMELLTTPEVLEDMRICLDAARAAWESWENADAEDDE